MRCDLVGDNIGEPAFTRCPVGSAVSPIWDTCVRQEVKESKIPENELNKRRSKMVVPGSKLDLGFDESRIPILVIQQPGTRGELLVLDVIFFFNY